MAGDPRSHKCCGGTHSHGYWSGGAQSHGCLVGVGTGRHFLSITVPIKYSASCLPMSLVFLLLPSVSWGESAQQKEDTQVEKKVFVGVLRATENSTVGHLGACSGQGMRSDTWQSGKGMARSSPVLVIEEGQQHGTSLRCVLVYFVCVHMHYVYLCLCPCTYIHYMCTCVYLWICLCAYK